MKITLRVLTGQLEKGVALNRDGKTWKKQLMSRVAETGV
jgi:hypothetical protein